MKKYLLITIAALVLTGCSKFNFSSPETYSASVKAQAKKEKFTEEQALSIIDGYVNLKAKEDYQKLVDDKEISKEEKTKKLLKLKKKVIGSSTLKDMRLEIEKDGYAKAIKTIAENCKVSEKDIEDAIVAFVNIRDTKKFEQWSKDGSKEYYLVNLKKAAAEEFKDAKAVKEILTKAAAIAFDNEVEKIAKERNVKNIDDAFAVIEQFISEKIKDIPQDDPKYYEEAKKLLTPEQLDKLIPVKK